MIILYNGKELEGNKKDLILDAINNGTNLIVSKGIWCRFEVVEQLGQLIMVKGVEF